MRNKWFARFLAAAFAVSVLLQPGGAALASEVQDTFDVAAEVKEGESVEVDKASSAPENVESLHEDSAEAVPSETAPSEGVDFQVNPDEVAGESGIALPREQDGINDTDGAMSRSTKVEILQTPFPSSQPSDDHTSNIEFRSPAPPHLGSQDGTVNGEYLASGSYGNVVWTIDENGKLTVEGTGDYAPNNASSYRSPWYEYHELIKSAEINLTDVVNASYMFHDCSNIVSVDVSNFSTSNVVNMERMFSNCSNITLLDLSNFNTSNVTDMRLMFSNCSNITTLDLSNFDTGNVWTMYGMFADCSNLATLDLSSFDARKAGNLSSMFNGCTKLTILNSPYNVNYAFASLPIVENTSWHLPDGTEVTELPQSLDYSVTLTRHDSNNGEEPEPAAPQELPVAVKYAPYDTSLQTPEASSLSMISGNLPTGLTLASDGRLSGVPTENGSFAFTVQATDNAEGSTREISYTLSVTEDTASNFNAYADPGYELTEVVPNQYFESIPDEGTQLVVSTGSFEEFTALYLDGEKLQDGADYTAESGSTRITILNQTLKRKGTGTHTLALEFRTKAAGALKWAAQNYVIAEGKAPSESEGQDTDTGNNNGNSNNAGTDNSADDNDTTENTASVIAYQVKHGDTLSKLAQRFYGSSSNWRRIFTDNAATIRNPNRIFPGQTLIITVAQNSASAEGQSTASNQTASNVGLTNSYTVVSGDNLYKIAQKVYGQGGRWNEIYQANKNVISNPGRIYAGQVLLIP